MLHSKQRRASDAYDTLLSRVDDMRTVYGSSSEENCVLLDRLEQFLQRMRILDPACRPTHGVSDGEAGGAPAATHVPAKDGRSENAGSTCASKQCRRGEDFDDFSDGNPAVLESPEADNVVAEKTLPVSILRRPSSFTPSRCRNICWDTHQTVCVIPARGESEGST
jgi:hypothetical protein